MTRALDLIQIRAQAVLGQRPQFNEILSAAYMEKQKMAVSYALFENSLHIIIRSPSSIATANEALGPLSHLYP